MNRSRLWVLWDLVIVTVVATLAYEYRTASTADMLIGLAMAAALFPRRRFPGPVLVVVAALALLQAFAGAAVPAGYDLALLVAMAAVVSHARRWWEPFAAGGVLVAGVVVLAVRSGDFSGPTEAGIPWYTRIHAGQYSALLVGCATVWLLAWSVRINRERAAVAEREADQLARLAAADERAAIARELHDVVAHSMAVMIAQADGASYAIARNPEAAGKAMRTVASTGRDALDDMHRIVAVLRGDGDSAAAGRRTAGLADLATLLERARAAGLRVDEQVEGDPGGVTGAEELTIFRLVQEGLTNTLRHCGPEASVTLTLRFRPGRAELELADDGAGRPPLLHQGSGGNGLLGMRERVAVHGGEFEAGPRDPSGWRLRAVLPVKEAA